MTLKLTCVNGHDIATVGRYRPGECKECTRIRVRAWKARNRDAVRKAARLDRELRRTVLGDRRKNRADFIRDETGKFTGGGQAGSRAQ